MQAGGGASVGAASTLRLYTASAFGNSALTAGALQCTGRCILEQSCIGQNSEPWVGMTRASLVLKGSVLSSSTCGAAGDQKTPLPAQQALGLRGQAGSAVFVEGSNVECGVELTDSFLVNSATNISLQELSRGITSANSTELCGSAELCEDDKDVKSVRNEASQAGMGQEFECPDKLERVFSPHRAPPNSPFCIRNGCTAADECPENATLLSRQWQCKRDLNAQVVRRFDTENNRFCVQYVQCGNVQLSQIGPDNAQLKITVDAPDKPEFVVSRTDAAVTLNSTKTAQGVWSANSTMQPGSWKVGYTSRGRVCPEKHLQPVRELQDLLCKNAEVSVDGATTALDADLVVSKQIAATAMVEVKLQETAISKLDGEYNIRYVPSTVKKSPLNEEGRAQLEVAETGNFSIDLQRDGKSVCTVVSTLSLHCKSGYNQQGSKCTPVRSDKATNLQKILGICIGITLAFGLILVAYYIRKRPSATALFHQPRFACGICGGLF